MLTLQNRPQKLCDGLTRRDWLHAGTLASLGLSLPQLTASQAAADSSTAERNSGRAKRCIILFLLGGPPQQETWDPKPDAPAEVRGEFKPISSAVPGIHVGELMPKTARVVDDIAILRACSTNDNAHSSSGYWMLTGTPHQPTNSENSKSGAPNDRPCTAAVVRHLRGDKGGIPGSVRLPEEIWNTGRIVWPGQDAGWLGHTADPWLLTCDPNAEDFQVPDLGLPEDIPTLRLNRRKSLLQNVDQHLDAVAESASVQRWSGLTASAFELLRSSATRAAFDLDRESPLVRDRYGRNRFGQSVLLARRLIEAGVSLVQVNWTRWKHDQAVAPAWDTHANNAERLKKDLMPPMDLAYSALLEDLKQRGLLDDTLVVWMGEFGRTPKINPRGGRDHWGHVFSVAMAGGGVQGGRVIGASDKIAAFPKQGRLEPQDLTATVYHCLGYRPELSIRDQFSRPLAISNGRILNEIL